MNKDEKAATKMYSTLANEYHGLRMKKSFYNEFIEMPNMLKMLGDLSNKKVLDWGCGSGIYIKKLKNNCKLIKGFDISPEMIYIAKEINPSIDLRIGSGNKIPFDEKFDIVFASLALHYLKDLNPVFKELKRVLKKDGLVIFSTGNPITKLGKSKYIDGQKYKLLGVKNYFKLDKTESLHISSDGTKTNVYNYIIKIKDVVNLCQKHGFEIVDYEDTKPLLSSKKLFPKEYAFYSKVPAFSIWKLKLL